MNKYFERSSNFFAWLLLLIYLWGYYDASLAATNNGQDATIVGEVINVHDGDGVVILLQNNEKIKIRMYGVDSPEKEYSGCWPSQPYSNAARKFTHNMVFGKTVTVRLTGDKTYKRLVGEVFYNDQSVSRELLRNGLAWWNKKYSPNDHELSQLQMQARKNRIGLWQDKNPTPPWVHRRIHKSKSSCGLK